VQGLRRHRLIVVSESRLAPERILANQPANVKEKALPMSPGSFFAEQQPAAVERRLSRDK